ncbi:MAG TPA: acetate uptake transporter [Candidatus Acidoferrales bacterium]|nr:acetate uptake transporter [Candidatus Acidoferrales bacterium]
MAGEKGEMHMISEGPQVDAQPRVFLQPIAAPSVLGLYGLAGATFMVAAWMTHWYGSSQTTLLLMPFAALFGGLAQFLSGMWAYKARDAVATAVHGMWGAFWIAFGILALILMAGKAAEPTTPFVPALGFWFIVLSAVTWVCVGAATAENKSLVTTLVFLAAGSTISAIALFTGAESLMILAGYLFIICAIAAWYTASALMLNEAFGREVWALGRSVQARQMPQISTGIGEPGVIRGQA